MSKVEIEFESLHTLPESWEWRPLEKVIHNPKQEIVDGPFGSNLKASDYIDDGVPIVRLQNIDRNEFVHKNIRFVSAQKAEQLARHNFRPGDLLITKLGDPLGKTCIAPHSISSGIIVADVVRVRIEHDEIDSRYLMYAINSPFVARQFEFHTKGTTRPRINLGIVRSLPIPVAPKTQQKLIVAEIEKQFSRLDEAVANLIRIKANLKRYKAAVLKDAVEGKLTEAWRKAHPDVEPAAKLLERILTERRAKWKGKGKYKESAVPDRNNLPALPKGWIWTSLGQIFEVCIGATPSRGKPEYWNGDIAWISSGEVAFCRIRQTRERITEKGLANTSTKMQPPGTVLLGMIGEGKTRGQAAVLDIAACNNQNSAAIRVSEAGILPEYVYRYLEGQYAENRSIGSGNNQPALNKARVQAIPLPLSPLAEQEQIVAEVERRLSFIEELEATVEANLTRANRLRQSILKCAFSGNLDESSFLYLSQECREPKSFNS